MNSFIKKLSRRQRGSLTVEASLVLPIFICAILTIGFLTKIVYIHEVIQHGITEAANEMASSSYLYYVSGSYDIDDTLSSNLEEKKKKSEEHINNIVDCSKELYDCIGEIKAGSKDSNKDIADYPKDKIIGLASSIVKSELDKEKTHIGNTIIKQYIRKYGLTDSRLKKLDIEGLDFSHSSYLSSNQDIDVIVKYNVNIPLPIRIVDNIPIVQRATARAWLGGDQYADADALADADEDIGDKNKKVYVSKKGSSYHRYGCYRIFKDIEALDLREVKKLGLQPCKKCLPPLECNGRCIVFKSRRINDGKYHKKGCTHLFKDIMEIDLEEAAKGYKPCRICNPPRVDDNLD
ncbi:MAG: hypothetical protein N4A68_04145 [Maledivibacter sp.]|jgi:hypothetical protein|nr:hypothetical protein [Maledivibacter sp.]